MMAESTSAGPEGHKYAFIIIFIIIILTAAVSFVEKGGYLTFEDNNKTNLEDRGVVSSLIPAGPIDKGKNVIAKNVVRVRQNPAGTVLGEQDKRTVGKVVGGPETAFGETWWRVDYEEAPDGWVDDSSITARVFIFRMLNIIPIVYSLFLPIAVILSVLFLILIIIIFFKSYSYNKKERQKKANNDLTSATIFNDDKPVSDQLKGGGEKYQIDSTGGVDITPKNEKWEKVKSLISSHNSSDWRQAIIESDIILDNMLDKMGYHGESVGEKLKQIESSDFMTLNQAWEAHKVRNRVAHKGSDFVLNKREADRVVGLYEKVFREFFYI